MGQGESERGKGKRPVKKALMRNLLLGILDLYHNRNLYETIQSCLTQIPEGGGS